MRMQETICPYPNLFLTLVPGPVAFCHHEKESISRAVDVQLKFWPTESQNLAHNRDILNSHGLYWSYNGCVFFLDCFLGILIKSPYTSVLSLPLALALPLCLFGILGGGEGGGIGDGKQENVGGGELGILSGPLCHLVHSLQTEHYSTEDTLYQNLTPEGKPYPSL